MKQNANQRLAHLEETELQTNSKQTQEVLEKEQKNVTDRRLDRQNADYLSRYNILQRRQSKVDRFYDVHKLSWFIYFQRISRKYKMNKDESTAIWNRNDWTNSIKNIRRK